MGVFAIGIERSFHVPVQSDVEHSYSYAFKSSPLPVTGYTSTIKVQAKTPGVSTVTWSSTYVTRRPCSTRSQGWGGALMNLRQ